MLERGRLETLIRDFSKAHIAVVGDFALDGYWEGDMTRSELSRETPHYSKPIVSERYSAGAAGNVAVNLAGLGIGCVEAVTAVGDDWRGNVLQSILAEQGVSNEKIITSSDCRTAGYIKPILKGYQETAEDARIDFINDERPGTAVESEIIEAIAAAAKKADAVVLCDQFSAGVFSDACLQACNELAAAESAVFFADSRYRINAFKNALLKPNEIEACQAAGLDFRDAESIRQAGKALQAQGSEVLVTAGKDGAYYFGEEEFHQTGFPQTPPLDIVGAGDTFLAALTAVTAAGGSRREAAEAGCLASSVIVKKLNTTGTVHPSELLKRFDETH